MKNFYASVDGQADRFIKELLLSGGIDGHKVTENYRKYYSILSDIADAYGESSSENDGEIYGMLSRYKTQIKEVMYGEKKAVDLLAEPDNELSVAFFSDIVPLNGFKYNVIGEVLKKRAESCSNTLRIAVLAARQGGLLRYLDERLAGWNCVVDYLDSSPYYYNSEADKLKNIKAGYRHFDVSKYDPFLSHEGVVARTIMYRKRLKALIKKYQDAVYINLGCGFDDKFSQVDNGRLQWFDVDLPDQIAVRRKVYSDRERCKMLDGCALDGEWTKQIPKSKMYIIVMEGVLEFFSKEQVKTCLNMLCDSFEHGYLLTELHSPFLEKHSSHHDAVKHTNAKFGC